MKKLGCVGMVIVLLVIACVWNWYNTMQLKNSVRAIAAKVHGADVEGEAKLSRPDLVTALAEVENHTRRAKELVRKNRTREAQAELDDALSGLNSARELSTGIAGDAAQFLGKARENAEKVFRKAWDDISREVKSKKK